MRRRRAMPATATAALPAPGHGERGRAAPRSARTCVASTVGATACSGHSRVVAAYAPTSSAMIGDRDERRRRASGERRGRVASAARVRPARTGTRRPRECAVAGGASATIACFVDPPEGDAARRRGRAVARGQRRGRRTEADAPAATAVAAPTGGAGVEDVGGTVGAAPGPARRDVERDATVIRMHRRARRRHRTNPRGSPPAPTRARRTSRRRGGVVQCHPPKLPRSGRGYNHCINTGVRCAGLRGSEPRFDRRT